MSKENSPKAGVWDNLLEKAREERDSFEQSQLRLGRMQDEIARRDYDMKRFRELPASAPSSTRETPVGRKPGSPG